MKPMEDVKSMQDMTKVHRQQMYYQPSTDQKSLSACAYISLVELYQKIDSTRRLMSSMNTDNFDTWKADYLRTPHSQSSSFGTPSEGNFKRMFQLNQLFHYKQKSNGRGSTGGGSAERPMLSFPSDSSRPRHREESRTSKQSKFEAATAAAKARAIADLKRLHEGGTL
jgi:hypothetical protein